MLVFAFDRDWTVDVNPHPSRQAVPLEWVRELAHETEHAVYAIGNQDLADEAAIPGVVDIVGMHSDDWTRWLGGKRPDGYYERFPKRRERLALITDLHPEAEGYVVVDDLDLSDVDGWDHYHAWEFVPAVERGDIHADLPPVGGEATEGGEPLTDGGYPTLAGIVPGDAGDLAVWLDDWDEIPGYEIEYTTSGTIRTRLCRDIATYKMTNMAADEPTFQCVPAASEGDMFAVTISDIEAVHAVEPPMETYLPAAEAPEVQATALADLAEDNPHAVEVSRVLALLENADGEAQTAALHALRRVASTRPTACIPALPILESLLEEGCTAPGAALAAVWSIGNASPADIAPLTGVILPYLSADDSRVRRQTAGCITTITEADPTDTIDTVPGLVGLLEDRVATHHAAHSLALLAEADPGAVKLGAPVLADALADGELDDGTRLSATAALGRVANRDPAVAVDLVDEVAALLQAEDPKLRNNATGLLWEVSRLHADRVQAHVGTIAELLSADDDLARVNASAVLSRIAEDRPEQARPYLEQARPLLTDSHYQTRANACRVLGHLEDTASLDTLRTVSTDDDHEKVRKRAQWAISQIEPPAT